MKRKYVFVSVAVLLVAGIGAALALGQTRYIQTSCEINAEHNYAEIGMKKASAAGVASGREYDIQFGTDGLVVRFPPWYYAPRWSDTDIIFESPEKGAASGVLKLRTSGFFGRPEVKTIGVVKRPCWDAVAKYIRTDIAGSGITVHVSETNAR
jgi:hypothetical protein